MIEGYGAPDTNTPGNVGSFYRDLNTNTIYKCTGMSVKPVQKQFVDVYSHNPTAEYVWEQEGYVPEQNVEFWNPGEQAYSNPSSVVSETFNCTEVIKKLVIPEGYTSIVAPDTPTGGKGGALGSTFYYVSEVVVPSSMKNIPANAFSLHDSLNKVIVREGVETIGETAFSGSGNLREVELPSSIKTIASNAFNNDFNLVIRINKPENSIAGAPWTEYPEDDVTVIWTG